MKATGITSNERSTKIHHGAITTRRGSVGQSGTAQTGARLDTFTSSLLASTSTARYEIFFVLSCGKRIVMTVRFGASACDFGGRERLLFLEADGG
jgi:hypothetical protein